MVAVTALWLPILVAAVLVFVVSSIIHMVLGYHAGDYRALARQDEVQDALRRFQLGAGDYMLPKPGSMKEMNSPEFKAKYGKGPSLIMTVFPQGQNWMGVQLVTWFLYAVMVGVFTGYVAGITLPAGAPYMTVFRVTGTVAFMGYALALFQHSIWYQRRWTTTLISVFDGLIYGLLTAGAFGWLWPQVV